MKDPAKKRSKDSHTGSDARLDEALEETFPASDPPSTSPTSVGRPTHSPPPKAARKPAK
jgi:hypothetical protein